MCLLKLQKVVINYEIITDVTLHKLRYTAVSGESVV